MKYEFHRDFFYLMKQSIEKNSVTFLLGTRKSGKTVCLKQLQVELQNAVYIDMKTYSSDEERCKIFDEINESIASDEKKVYLIDEITYVKHVEVKLCEISSSYAEYDNRNTKIVLTGSQSTSLEAWSNRAFAGNCGKIKVDFLTYSEFLRFKGIKEVSAETYNRFLYEAADFYKLNSIKDYLEGCLEETIISNANTDNYIMNNECYLLVGKADLLCNILYQTLFTLHNQTSVQTFFKNEKLKDTIINIFRTVCNEIGSDTISKRIENSFVGSYNIIRSTELNTLQQALVFLLKCDLITITPVTDNFENVPDILLELLSSNSRINYKDELFKMFNITIKYPMFYVQILKDILKDEMPDILPNAILGSIVECNARGMLSDGFEYKGNIRDDKSGIVKQCEIDYINLFSSTAIEFTISANHNIYFDILPDYYRCILLTKDKSSVINGVERIPYYEFLYDLSNERYICEKQIEELKNNDEPEL